MDMIQTARQLGAALQKDERYLRYALAKQNNDDDKTLQELIGRLNLLRINYHTEISKVSQNTEVLKELSDEYRETHEKIMANKNMIEYNESKAELDSLVTYIQSIISLSAGGEDPETCEPPSGCSSDCSSCAGCH